MCWHWRFFPSILPFIYTFIYVPMCTGDGHIDSPRDRTNDQNAENFWPEHVPSLKRRENSGITSSCVLVSSSVFFWRFHVNRPLTILRGKKKEERDVSETEESSKKREFSTFSTFYMKLWKLLGWHSEVIPPMPLSKYNQVTSLTREMNCSGSVSQGAGEGIFIGYLGDSGTHILLDVFRDHRNMRGEKCGVGPVDLWGQHVTRISRHKWHHLNHSNQVKVQKYPLLVLTPAISHHCCEHSLISFQVAWWML